MYEVHHKTGLLVGANLYVCNGGRGGGMEPCKVKLRHERDSRKLLLPGEG